MFGNGRDIKGNDRIIQKNNSIPHGGSWLRNGPESIPVTSIFCDVSFEVLAEHIWKEAPVW